MPRISFLVSGDVQGVGFRYFARERALEHGLTGWVRNRWDGRVEGHAQGSGSALDLFMADLRRGPVSASIDSVGSSPLPDSTGEGSFRIER